MKGLPILKHNGQRILTTQQLAEIYETDINNIQNNFANHKENFVEGKHYYFLKGDLLKEFKNNLQVNNIDLQISNMTRSLYLWTERGANRHCKILDTDKAWEQFDNLEETYFQVKNEKLSGEDLIALAVVEAQKILSQKDKEIEMKNQVISELKPKVDYTDTILQSKALVNINQIAKDYGMSARQMNKILADKNIQYKQGNQWLLYRKYHDKGYTSSETVNITRTDGTPDVIMRTKWTQKGRLFIYELLRKSNILPIIEKTYSV
jgi:phage antirepressor YoqD-like protein